MRIKSVEEISGLEAEKGATALKELRDIQSEIADNTRKRKHLEFELAKHSDEAATLANKIATAELEENEYKRRREGLLEQRKAFQNITSAY